MNVSKEKAYTANNLHLNIWLLSKRNHGTLEMEIKVI